MLLIIIEIQLPKNPRSQFELLILLKNVFLIVCYLVKSSQKTWMKNEAAFFQFNELALKNLKNTFVNIFRCLNSSFVFHRISFKGKLQFCFFSEQLTYFNGNILNCTIKTVFIEIQ